MADSVKISALPASTDAQMTDAGLIETAVADTSSSTGFTSKKSTLARLATYILNKFTGLSLAGSSQTVKSALDSLNSNLTNLSSGTILDYVKSQVAAGVVDGHFIATQNVTDIPASGTAWFVHYTKNIGSNIAQLKAVQYNDSRVIYNTHIANASTSTSYAREWTQEPTRAEMDACLTGAVKSVSANVDTDITIPNNYRGCVAFIGYDTNCDGMLMIAVSSAGTVTHKWIGDAPSNITLATATRRLTVTSTQGVYLMFTNANQAIS